jgi:hypothetical protein
VEACKAAGRASQQCKQALYDTAATEFWNMKFMGGFQSTGLNQGFSTIPSDYAVSATSAAEVQAAVQFARRHNLRVVVKGAGHDYMGRNTATASGSLLISTTNMKGISWGAHNETVTVEAGEVWQDVYTQAQARGRFVQGGHCPSVGAVGGFSMGAGYGPTSRFYGTGADNMVSATVVTATGSMLFVNETANADLFWAIRGGGGGTFGITTSITYKTHPAPRLGGTVRGTVACPHDGSFELLLESFLAFLPDLFTPHWGDSVTPDALKRTIQLSLQYIQISSAQAKATWEPFLEVVRQSACSWSSSLTFKAMPTLTMQDGTKIIKMYPYPGAWHPSTGDPNVDMRLVDGFLGQLNQWSFGQAHRYIPKEDIEREPAMVARKLVELTKFQTSYRVLQLSKALAGGQGQATNISANPAARRAGVALMGNEHVANYFPNLPETQDTLWNLVKAGGVKSFFEVGLCTSPGSTFSECLSSQVQNMSDAKVKACWSGIHACFNQRTQQFHKNYLPALRKAFPTGSYANEGDYFEPAWQRTFFGDSYPRLLAVKHNFDPTGLFVCHHCVGSEHWTKDGNCQVHSDSHHALDALLI